jgi:hypothetical protein
MQLNLVNCLATRFRYKLQNLKVLSPNFLLKTVDTGGKNSL